jgi:hypothetical protein
MRSQSRAIAAQGSSGAQATFARLQQETNLAVQKIQSDVKSKKSDVGHPASTALQSHRSSMLRANRRIRSSRAAGLLCAEPVPVCLRSAVATPLQVLDMLLGYVATVPHQ